MRINSLHELNFHLNTIYILKEENMLDCFIEELANPDNKFFIPSDEEIIYDNIYYISPNTIATVLKKFNLTLKDLPLRCYFENNEFQFDTLLKEVYHYNLNTLPKEKAYLAGGAIGLAAVALGGPIGLLGGALGAYLTTKAFFNKSKPSVIKETREPYSKTATEIIDSSTQLIDSGEDVVKELTLEDIEEINIHVQEELEEKTNLVTKGDLDQALKLILGKLHDIDSTMNTNFEKLFIKLDQIQNDLIIRKSEYAKELEVIDDSKDKELDAFILENVGDLRNQIDLEIYDSTIEVINSVVKKPPVLLSRFAYLKTFEEDSKQMIQSCLIVEKLIQQQNLSLFDYSLCSVGYWKAIEIELNIIVADTLRFLHQAIREIPSDGISLKNGAINIFAGLIYPDKKERFININKKHNKRLKPLMFGELMAIAQHYNHNQLKLFLNHAEKYIENIQDCDSFINAFLNDLDLVVKEYRNRCSHIGTMNGLQYNELKNLLFNEGGLLQRVGYLKEACYNLSHIE